VIIASVEAKAPSAGTTTCSNDVIGCNMDEKYSSDTNYSNICVDLTDLSYLHLVLSPQALPSSTPHHKQKE
jgi:hypothetical protein